MVMDMKPDIDFVQRHFKKPVREKNMAKGLFYIGIRILIVI